jgi:hypothetical protein
VVKATPRPLYPGKESRCSLHSRLNGSEGRAGQLPMEVWKDKMNMEPRRVGCNGDVWM